MTNTENATFFLDRGEGRIAYDDTGGDGPLVVALPSMGDVRQEYRFLATTLVEAGYRVVTADLRGLGESTTGWSSYSATAIGSDLLALIDHLDAGPALVVGTSMAAGASAWAAAERPELVAGLVLIGPFVRDIRPTFMQSLALALLLRRPWGPAAWGAYYKSLYPGTPPADLDAYRAALTANLREPGRFEATVAMGAASKADVEARLSDVQTPALVLMGSRDPDFRDPSAEAELVASRVHGRVVMIDGAGHYPHAEQPAATAPHVLDFFAAITKEQPDGRADRP